MEMRGSVAGTKV
jgi:hypothetical protein